jgi:uncharacterized SAM-binding protein YcdF (DUF218 family)
MSITLVAAAIAHMFLLPPASLFSMIGAGMIFRRWWPRAGRAISISSLILLVVLCTDAGARLLVQPLENLTAPLKSSEDTHAQAIVVLAAGRLRNAPEYAGTDIPDYIALARLRYAAKLQHETGLPILVSGGNGSLERTTESEAVCMTRALQEDFRTPVKWIEGKSNNTAENAAFSAKILKQAGLRRILLVTDAMHMARAKEVFLHNGLEVIAAPTMFFGGGQLTLFQFLPNPEGLRRSYYATYEWIGLAWYRLREVIAK